MCIKSADESLETIKQMIELLQYFDASWETLFNAVNDDDKIQNDILHRLELEKMNRKQLADTAQELKDIRTRRRQAKNEMAILQPFKDFLQDNKSLYINLAKTYGKMKKIKDRQETPEYIERIPGSCDNI